MRSSWFYFGLASLTGSLLALEVLDTRLLSVLTWYSIAFFVIAMGLFGLTAGAVRVYLGGAAWEGQRLPSQLASETRRFAWSIPVSYILLLIIPLRSDATLTTVPLFVVFSLAIALPFYPAGAAVAAALTKTSLPVGRVYAVDLVGAALGAPLVYFLLEGLRGGTAILALGVIGGLAATCFAIAGGDAVERRRSLRATALLFALTVVDGMSQRGLVPLWIKGRPELRDFIAHEAWNSHSRVIVLHAARVPAMFWGAGHKCKPPLVNQRGAEIDGHAATPIYLPEKGLEELSFLDCDVSNVVHRIRPQGSLAVIGVGGSRDIQAALLAGHSPVVGIEFNRRMLEILRGPLGAGTGIPERREVELVHDEARSWLARTDREFAVLQMSLIDTWAATGAGAHALGENGLYTKEAWRIFLSRLAPGGVFTVSRWSSVESLRVTALAVTALHERGVTEPGKHLAILRGGEVTTLLVGRDPFTPDDERKLEALADEKGFVVAWLPSRPSNVPQLRDVIIARNAGELERATSGAVLDLSPTSDDRPFFFNVLKLAALWSPLPVASYGPIEGNLVATRTLGLGFLVSLGLVVVGIGVPLARRAKPDGRSGGKLYAALGYFALIGVGFMLGEIALLQRCSLVLGHPSYSLMVVLASLVAATGIGALASDRLPLDRAPWCYVMPLTAAGILAAVALAWSSLAPRFAASPTGARIAFALSVCTGVGFVLGMAYPLGMRAVRAAHAEETPWLWGVNGMGSVLASSAAVALALSLGLTRLTLVAAACYVLLVPTLWVLRKPRA